MSRAFLIIAFLIWTINGAGHSPDSLPAAPDTSAFQLFFPGLSPLMIGVGEFELGLFNRLGTQQIETEIETPAGPLKEQSRLTRLDHILQLTSGITRRRRLNAGLDLYYSHFRADSDEESTPWKVLGSDKATGESYHSLSGLGLRLRALPIRSLPELNLQSTVIFPVASGLEKRQAAGRDRTQWLTQISFYQQFRPWLYIFLTLDASILFENGDRRQTTYTFPAGLYVIGEVVRKKVYAYPSLQYVPDYEKTFKGPLRRTSYQLLFGLGAQYYPSSNFALNLLLQRPLDYDIGSLSSDIVPGSYTIVHLGGRYVIGKR